MKGRNRFIQSSRDPLLRQAYTSLGEGMNGFYAINRAVVDLEVYWDVRYYSGILLLVRHSPHGASNHKLCSVRHVNF